MIKNYNIFENKNNKINKLHDLQTVEDINNLNEKYEKINIFEEKLTLYEIIQKLKEIKDPTDIELKNENQSIHIAQILYALEKDNVKDKLLYTSLLVHDAGKLLALTNESYANIYCGNKVVFGEINSGLDNCVLQWNHDEFIYLKLKNYLPYKYLWLIRYHSIRIKECSPYFNEIDKKYLEDLRIFKKYDKLTKKLTNYGDVDKYIKIAEEFLPYKITI